MNPLFSALQETYASEGDLPLENTSTVKGLMAYARRWLTGAVPADDLRPALHTMRARIQQAAVDTKADLDKAGTLDPALRDPVERSYEGYLAIGDALDEMLEALDANAAPLFKQSLSMLEDVSEEMSAAQREIKLWMFGTDPRCPKCGISDESQRCKGCDLDFLIPDVDAAMDQSQRTGFLRQEYLDVFKAYVGVISGECRLPRLWAALNPLEELLGQFHALAGQIMSVEGGADVGRALEACLEDSLDGIDRMRMAAESRQMIDLNQGWNQIFDSALHLQHIVPELARTAGQEDTAHSVQAQMGSTDSISISGD